MADAFSLPGSNFFFALVVVFVKRLSRICLGRVWIVLVIIIRWKGLCRFCWIMVIGWSPTSVALARWLEHLPHLITIYFGEISFWTFSSCLVPDFFNNESSLHTQQCKACQHCTRITPSKLFHLNKHASSGGEVMKHAKRQQLRVSRDG